MQLMQRRLAEIAAADRLAKLQDQVHIMRDLWDRATSATTSVVEKQDFISAAGALHASVSTSLLDPWKRHEQDIGGNTAGDGIYKSLLSSGVVPWNIIDGKSGCSDYFRSIGKLASDPGRPVGSCVAATSAR